MARDAAHRGRVRRITLASGIVAAASSAAGLALLARAEGKGALRPVNATSHWLNGDRAGAFEGADLVHTAVGYATHQAATLFWAAIFARWIAGGLPLGMLPMLGRASAVSALAALVDYRATPRRLTPGWELVLSKGSMAGAYVAMALGLAAGASLIQHGPRASSL